MTGRTLSLFLAALALTACASPEARLRTGLIDAGLSRGQSACMAERMVDKLSLTQLRRISALGNFRGDKIAEMSVDRFLRNIRALQDPEILTVTTRAALGCAISG
jgi:hypothetical protein